MNQNRKQKKHSRNKVNGQHNSAGSQKATPNSNQKLFEGVEESHRKKKDKAKKSANHSQEDDDDDDPQHKDHKKKAASQDDSDDVSSHGMTKGEVEETQNKGARA